MGEVLKYIQIVMQLLSLIVPFIQQVQLLFPEPGDGAKRKNEVLGMIEGFAVGNGLSQTKAKKLAKSMSGTIDAMVGNLNAAGALPKGASAIKSAEAEPERSPAPAPEVQAAAVTQSEVTRPGGVPD